MNLYLLTDQSEIERAYDELQRSLTRGASTIPATLGYKGGQERGRVRWQAERGFWSYCKPLGNRYWCAFGTDDPHAGAQLNIVVEINSPLRGVNRQVAGMFVKDDRGAVYLAHSGRVGGGRPGIGKAAFLERMEALHDIKTDDGKPIPAVVVGRVAGKRFTAHLAHFVRQVADFKNEITQGTVPTLEPALRPPYRPEFSGKRRSYRVGGDIEGQCDHGLVVDALKAACDERGLRAGRDVPRDLYVSGRSGRMKMLFEVKTDQTTSSIYEAIGQLMFHTAGVQPRPKCVAVVPGTLADATRKRLDALAIAVVSYAWDGDRPVFDGLTPILKALRKGD